MKRYSGEAEKISKLIKTVLRWILRGSIGPISNNNNTNVLFLKALYCPKYRYKEKENQINPQHR